MPHRVDLCIYIKAEHNKQRDQAKLINMARRSVTFCVYITKWWHSYGDFLSSWHRCATESEMTFKLLPSLQSNFANGGVPQTHFHCFSNYWLVKSLCLYRDRIEALIYFEQIAGLLLLTSVTLILQLTFQNVTTSQSLKSFLEKDK